MDRVIQSDFQENKGFSLFELLAVLAIVAVLLAMTPTLFQGLLTSTGVSGGAEIAASVVALARGEAQLSAGEARLVIDVGSGSPGYLQRMAVAREVELEDGTRKWLPTSSAKFLPGGVFLYQPFVGGDQSMTFQYSSSEEPTEWIYFAFDSLGRLQVPLNQNSERSQLVFIQGELDESSSLVVTEGARKAMTGFVLRKSGSITFFPSTPTAP